ncbi:uncharacterized protein LOC143890298 isoform X2 [Tasmannia lanceolata]|uniref:uncharacterized protein LOC143890298 isoform X2 n=1 Tax=Tasmannia lanceolata TaxID=3420 RepID=UPI00406313CC
MDPQAKYATSSIGSSWKQNQNLKNATGNKGKATMGYTKDWQKLIKDSLVKDLMNSKPDPGLATGASLNPLKSSGPSSEDLSYFDKYYEDYFDLMDIDNDDVLSFDTQFAAVNQPPWVEAPTPSLEEPANQNPSTQISGASSSIAPWQPSSSKEKEENEEEILEKFRQFKQFETVCDYSDHYFQGGSQTEKSPITWSLEAASAHIHNFLEPLPVLNPFQTNLYPNMPQFPSPLLPPLPPPPFSPLPPLPPPPPALDSKQWTRKIQQEWKILEKDLPELIFVRVYEERMDLLRAVIVGAAGTPYQDGLFFFDISFPPNYPHQPPLVYYYSGGLRLNPNLYASGKVCLSLLNTWSGNKDEMWTPGKSTMLQVLVSIQALVLNAKPYFNEPGYAITAGTPNGEKRSLAYNEDTFLLSCKTMIYTLQKPPKHFEDFIVGHFRQRTHDILETCNAYMDGARVGCLGGGAVQDGDGGDKSSSSKFKKMMGQIFPRLLKAFADNGADCQKFSNLKSQVDAHTVLELGAQNFEP